MKLVFLDRDGVINRFPGVGHYVTRWEEFEFLPNAAQAVALLTKAGYEVVVVSNQGCVAHGLISSEGLRALTDKMRGEIERVGGRLDGVFYCEHRTADDCECKKPRLGLLKKALSGRSVDRRSCYFIGDSEIDIEAGRNAGCQTVLVLSGRVRRPDLAALPVAPDAVKDDLWEAAQWIVQKKS